MNLLMPPYLKIITLFLLLNAVTMAGQSGQITIPRVEQMPNQPSPYNMRNWREVALGYDSFVYDATKTGQYLPLVRLQANGVNYPQYPSFGLHTYVGTNAPQGNEAINVLPSLVGATLSGIDKSNQFGKNWVRMSQDFFNKNNGESIYLNSPNSGSGNDWWYDLMPNVYFYQLYDLYPSMGGDADFQFTTVADRFLASVRAMGGNDAPWQKAFMNYRAWNFKTMQPNTTSVPEPEAAGAYAWVLYNAYKKTGNPAYLQGAEWSMEFLSSWTTNPSYEMQLPYGTYTAAKMNAELGTHYDVEKMVNWSFDRGALRGWGTIVGTWGGYQVSGLVGEANDGGNDYAFQMNGVQQAAMLVPMVRYDKRFARAIGKWVLNLANATRLFYRGFLPSTLQDASAWSNTNDPDRVIGYEALREQWQGNSPVSTGDAVGGGWANTNLALYGTSSIGYLGALLEKTNVNQILKIDLLKTDFFGDPAFPTYLLYNPYPTAKTIALAVGNSPIDVYDALSESFLLQGVNGTVNLTIAADAALLITLTPTGGAKTYDGPKLLVDGTIVDYQQSVQPFQYVPRIQGLSASKTTVELTDSARVFSAISDQDSNNFTYYWSADGGSITGSGSSVAWYPPAAQGTYNVTLIVADESDNRDTATVAILVVPEINQAPQIAGIQKSDAYLSPGGTLQLSCSATDPNGDPLTYFWTSSSGAMLPLGNTAAWTASALEGVVQFQVTVLDDQGLSASATATVLVYNFDNTTGNIIAYYPFSGNANDVSGNGQHGQPSGALNVADWNGHPASAYTFDGVNDNISVPNSPILNFQQGITISGRFSAKLLPNHEIFLLSHGSWQNRWKLSITPERRIRWTLNSVAAIGDLDSETTITKDSLYHFSATYDGTLLALFINGKLESYKSLGGLIRTTTLPFLMGQILPGVTDFNFKGLLDDVKIFDYALHPSAVQSLYQNSLTSILQPSGEPEVVQLFPNPVEETLYISLPSAAKEEANIAIFNPAGQRVKSHNTVAESPVIIDVKNYKSGVYTVIITTNSRCYTARFIKM
jgi:hypothetical protein